MLTGLGNTLDEVQCLRCLACRQSFCYANPPVVECLSHFIPISLPSTQGLANAQSSPSRMILNNNRSSNWNLAPIVVLRQYQSCLSNNNIKSIPTAVPQTDDQQLGGKREEWVRASLSILATLHGNLTSNAVTSHRISSSGDSSSCPLPPHHAESNGQTRLRVGTAYSCNW